MSITVPGLGRACAAAAVVAGAIYVTVQIGHPPLDVASVSSPGWVVRSTAKTVMAALALVAITGLYLRHRRCTGLLAAAGYLLFAVGYLCMFATELIAAAVLPALAVDQPGYVQDLLLAAAGNEPDGDIGGMQVVLTLTGLGYLLGGLLFGTAMFRARIMPAWACLLLAAGAVGTLFLAVLPDAFNRPMAVPVGVALIGLGVGLWRTPVDEGAELRAVPEAV